MTKKQRLVLIDGGTLACVCPWHGPQPEAQDYIAGTAACGCLWEMHRGGLLFAVLQQKTSSQQRNSTVTLPT